jgi:hypothetical protein
MSAYDPKRTSITPSEALDFIVTMARSSASGVAMRRRDVITLLGGAAAAWPFAARAQQSDRARRIGALIGIEDDATSKAMHEAFRQGLEQLGWTDGRNVRIDARFGGGILFALASTQRNWWRLRRMSSWLLAVLPHN